MTDKRSVRTRIPNGEEIKKLRLAKGVTQQEFVNQGGLTQRTLQRAEQGQPVGSHHLSVIATRLAVPLEQIVATNTVKKEHGAEQEDIIRLTPARGKRLIDWLQGWNSIRYFFNVDPDGRTALLIADIIDFCDAFSIKETGLSKLKPAEKIRVIGDLNDRIAVLAGCGVEIFAEHRFIWTSKREKIDNEVDRHFWTPEVTAQVMIDFEPIGEPFVKLSNSTFYTKEAVYEECAKLNMSDNVEPDVLEAQNPFTLDPRFLPFYRKCWDAARVLPPADAKVINLRHSD